MSKELEIGDDEIDLIELAKTIWSGRKFIAKVTGFFLVFGFVIAFTTPEEYEASCRLLPESQEGSIPNLGGLESLAGLAGIDIGDMSAGGVLSPQLYPEIVNSIPFVLAVIKDSIYFENIQKKTSTYDYLKNHENISLIGAVMKYTLGLPGLIKKMLTEEGKNSGTKDDGFVRLTKADYKIIEKFKERISVELDDVSGIVSITVKMQDAFAAAQLAKLVEEKMTEEIVRYKTDKAKNSLLFIENSFKDAKEKFETLQLVLANLTDQNKNVSGVSAQIELRNAQNEYDVAFDVYKGLASQVEQAKIKLKEETPVFTVLEPVRVPEDKSEPKTGVLLIAMTFLGGFISVMVLLIQYLVNESRKKR